MEVIENINLDDIRLDDINLEDIRLDAIKLEDINLDDSKYIYSLNKYTYLFYNII